MKTCAITAQTGTVAASKPTPTTAPVTAPAPVAADPRAKLAINVSNVEPARVDVMKAASRDPRMEGIYRQYLADWLPCWAS